MTRKWHSGPPPHVGWWLTKHEGVGFFSNWRWWDGEQWSYAVYESADIEYVEYYASRYAREELNEAMLWCNYWPKNARVPRVDPRRTK